MEIWLEEYFPAPTLLDHVSATARVATEEIFGPVLSLIRVDSVEEAIAAANGVRYGLTGSVYTANLSRAFEVIQHLESGITHVNNPTIGGEAHLPFGGIKHTGTGPREMGPDAWKSMPKKKPFTSTMPVVCAKATSTKWGDRISLSISMASSLVDPIPNQNSCISPFMQRTFCASA